MPTVNLKAHNTVSLNNAEVTDLTAKDVGWAHRANILNAGPGKLWLSSDKSGLPAAIGSVDCLLLPPMTADNGMEFDKNISVIAEGATQIVVRIVE